MPTHFNTLESDAMPRLLEVFGEDITFVPLGIEGRTVTVLIDEHREATDEVNTQTDCEYISVECLRDEEDATWGGIKAPNRGDKLIRAESIDRDQRPYAYTGKTTQATPISHALIFERRTRRTQGAR